jgi:hypothetical protein
MVKSPGSELSALCLVLLAIRGLTMIKVNKCAHFKCLLCGFFNFFNVLFSAFLIVFLIVIFNAHFQIWTNKFEPIAMQSHM